MSTKKNGSSTKKNEPEKTFDVREVVLAKLRGFPQWPGMVVDPDDAPKAVLKERPPVKKSVVYCVRFFPAGDYAWLGPKELVQLTPTKIREYIEEPNSSGRKAGDLMDGYKAALDPEAWEADHAAKPPATKKRSKKGSKKSKAADDDEEEEEEEAKEEEDELEDEDKPGKKRKRTAEPASKAKGKKGGKTKSKKSKAHVESEDDKDDGAGDDDAEPASKKAKTNADSQLENDPEAVKVRDWRHKLQKTFLSSSKTPPRDDEMPEIDKLFTAVEKYDGMNIDYLTFSKIGKVMRHIHVLDPARVPRDEEFKFRDRAKALVDQWHQILNANKSSGQKDKDVDMNGTNGVNGVTDGDLTMLNEDAMVE